MYLNAKMIKRFHEIIEKKSILKAKTFLHGSSQLCLTQTTISEQETEIIEDDTDDDRFEKVSKSQVCFSCLSETSFRNSPTLFFSQDMKRTQSSKQKKWREMLYSV